MSMDLEIMQQIQEQKETRMQGVGELPELDPETAALAEEKRKAFDLPTNAVKVDPLR